MAYEVDIGRYFTVPLKKSQDVDMVKPIETFVKNTYDKADEDILKHIREFNSLRKTAVAKPLDKSVSSLNTLHTYHDQLVAAAKKIPFREATGVQVLFVWKDSLQKGKFLSSTPKLSMVDGEFERLCVLYNIAALMSQIGSEANMQTDDGLKAAAKYFQESAGIFTYIKDRIVSVAGEQQPTADLTPDILNALKVTMVAQAQECFYDKASSDPSLNRKPDMVAKIASQAGSLYGEALKAFNDAESNYSLNSVSDMCSAKKDLFECRAQLYQARAANEKKQFGEAIARYRLLEPTLKNLTKSVGDMFPDYNLKQLYSVTVSEREAAEKDNNFIYNDVIPKASTLPLIGKAQIAKAKAYNPDEYLSQKFTDMFSSLVPLAVHNALESYESRRKELVDRQVERLREQTTLINSVMSSLNLPAALEDVSGSDIPASILEKSRTVIAKGGATPIDQLLTDLPDALERNQEILSESVRMLNEEQATDAELREKFGQKWTRKPSAELTAPLRQEANKYQTIIENAQKADGIVRQKYHESKRGIQLLCLPENELKKAVPSASPVASLRDHEVVKELKSLCEKVETLKAEREVVENELKTTSCDMTSKFTQVLAEDGALNEENISPAELDRIYQPLIEQVTESVGKQESIQANLQRASEQFSVLKQKGGGANSREEMLKEMAAAFDKYMELNAHLQEGTKFYGDLTELLLKLQGKCSDLVFARKTEKEELLKDLQQSIVSQQTGATPAVPSYHQQDTYAQVNKPARPPPPVVTSSAPAAPATQPAPPKPAPRRNPTSAAPPAAAAAQAPAATSASFPPGPTPTTQAPYGAHQQPPYAYPQATAPGYPAYPGYGAPPPQGSAPYPTQPGYAYPPQPGTYAPQGYAAYPSQPAYPGQPGYPPQGPPGQPGYPPYGQQPYYYPPSQ